MLDKIRLATYDQLSKNRIKKIIKIKKVKKVKKKYPKINLNIMKTSEGTQKDNTKVISKNSNSSLNIKGLNYNIKILNDKINNITNNKNINLNDYELNNLSYYDALRFDNRGYFQYYFSLLKMKHIIIFTFYTNSDYNSRIIKIVLFIFSFSLYFTINTFFFNDSTMHKIYEEQGNFNFIYQLPQILYSTVICSIINAIIKYLSLSEKDILKLKEKRNNLKEKSDSLLKLLQCKFIVFYILIYIFLILFWYYVSSFCVVYKNTQIHLIKDTLISFSLSLIYPFGLNLLPGILRIPSVRSKEREIMYMISKFIQLI